MHKCPKHKIKHIIGFRRWSHKGWAVFSSLSQVVRICTLKKSIADKSFTKQQSNKLLDIQSTNTIQDLLPFSDDEVTGRDEVCFLQERNSVALALIEDCAHCFETLNLIKIQPAYMINHIGRFFINILIKKQL